MPELTEIEWTDSTVNPTVGCEGCELWVPGGRICYAGRRHPRFAEAHGLSPNFEDLTHRPGAMAEAAAWPDLAGIRRAGRPWLDELPRIIFVSDLSDALSSRFSFEYLFEEIIANVKSRRGRRHQWLWLTKRPERMVEFSTTLREWGVAWPPNLWAGTSITRQSSTNRIKDLLHVGDERTIRFLSVEPQWEPIDLAAWLPRLGWIIQGGESGAGATPFDLRWARDLRDACAAARVPYFLKQLGTKVVDDGKLRPKTFDFSNSDWNGWPVDLRVREFPTPSLDKRSLAVLRVLRK